MFSLVDSEHGVTGLLDTGHNRVYVNWAHRAIEPHCDKCNLSFENGGVLEMIPTSGSDTLVFRSLSFPQVTFLILKVIEGQIR